MVVNLTEREIWLILHGITGAQYPNDVEKEAFELVMKLRALLREQV